jgi:hypothetical protein
VTPPGPDVPRAPSAGVLTADARALRYGVSAPAVFDNPEMRDKVRALFGSDWSPAAQGGGRLEFGAASYFPPDSSIRMIRLDGQAYIAISGCVPQACGTHRGLVLIGAEGDRLWARLDEGGFSRYYGHGPAMTGALVSPAFIDGAWRALERLEQTAAGRPAESGS